MRNLNSFEITKVLYLNLISSTLLIASIEETLMNSITLFSLACEQYVEKNFIYKAN